MRSEHKAGVIFGARIDFNYDNCGDTEYDLDGDLIVKGCGADCWNQDDGGFVFGFKSSVQEVGSFADKTLIQQASIQQPLDAIAQARMLSDALDELRGEDLLNDTRSNTDIISDMRWHLYLTSP